MEVKRSAPVRLLGITKQGVVLGDVTCSARTVGAVRLLWENGDVSRGRDISAEVAAVATVVQGRSANLRVELNEPPSPGSEIQLVLLQTGVQQTLSSMAVGAPAGAIKAVYDDGSVMGWCIGLEGRALELVIDGVPAMTLLADRYSPDLTTATEVVFCDFCANLPFALFATTPPEAQITLRCVDDGRTLFTSALSTLRNVGVSIGGALPTDVISVVSPDLVVDDLAVQAFYRRHGVEKFVETAYNYILERCPDDVGKLNFIDKLTSDELNVSEVLLTMLGSDERSANGALLGPFVGDPGYPFAMPSASFEDDGNEDEAAICLPDGGGVTAACLVVPGQPLAFGGEETRDCLVFGWGDPEESWRWITGHAAVLRFGLTRPAKCTLLRLRCRSVTGAPAINAVTVMLNGSLLGRRELEDEAWIELSFVVPADVARGANELWIDASQVATVPGDSRELSICVRDLTVD